MQAACDPCSKWEQQVTVASNAEYVAEFGTNVVLMSGWAGWIDNWIWSENRAEMAAATSWRTASAMVVLLMTLADCKWTDVVMALIVVTGIWLLTSVLLTATALTNVAVVWVVLAIRVLRVLRLWLFQFIRLFLHLVYF